MTPLAVGLSSGGCTASFETAYWENQRYGGGTALLATQRWGLRPLPSLGGQWAGRSSWSVLEDAEGLVWVDI